MTTSDDRTPYTPGHPSPYATGGYIPPTPPGQHGPFPVPEQAPQPSPPKKKHTARTVALVVAGAVLAVCGIGGIAAIADGGGSTRDKAVTSDTTPDPTPAATTEAPVAEPVVTDKPAAPATKPAARTFTKITHRTWLKIAKNPDAYVGKGYVVYGVVDQFDSATGEDTFRASVDGVKRAARYDYETNTILTGDAERLADFVEDDGFTAKVLVVGSFDYDTQIGGSTTVPQLQIVSISPIKVAEY